MKHRCRSALIIFFLTNACLCAEKHWLPNLEWQTAGNWLSNRVPEIDSQVIFPLETRHAVGIARSADLRLAEIDLARFGSLVLSRDGKLELTEPKPPRKISQWKREGHLFWADPGNWNGSSDAAPHLERVPCRRDDIVLPPKEKTFSMLLPIKDIQVRSVKMANEKHPFTRWQWQDLHDRKEFERGRFTVKYSEYSCEKCPCQDDLSDDYIEEICAIERPKCGFTGCEYPLKVEGHCCQYCGGRVSLSNKASLPMVKSATMEALEGYTDRISWHVRRTWNGAAEVLLKEKGDYSGVEILEAVQNVQAMLQSTGIEVLSVETAGAAMQDNRLAVALAPLLGTPLIVLALLVVAFLYFGYSLRHILMACGEMFSSIRDGIRVDKSDSGKPFGFARFENIPEGSVQIANAPGTSEKTENGETDGKNVSGGRFENPLYRSKRRRGEERDILDMDEPLSLTTLQDKVEHSMEEVEMDTDQ